MGGESGETGCHHDARHPNILISAVRLSRFHVFECLPPGVRDVGDATLVCKQCGRLFVFSEGEQAFYLDHGYGPPTRCPYCRDARRAFASPAQVEPRSVQRQAFAAICSDCG